MSSTERRDRQMLYALARGNCEHLISGCMASCRFTFPSYTHRGVAHGLPDEKRNIKKRQMEKINDQDTRSDIIRKFDDCMTQFFERTRSFLDEITRIAKSDEDNTKIYLRALELAMDLKLVGDTARRYDEEIRYSMLDTRTDRHCAYRRDMAEKLMEFRQRVNTIIQSQSLGIDRGEMDQRTGAEEPDTTAGSGTATALQPYLCVLSRELADRTVPIFKEIAHTVGYLDQLFAELSTLHVSRTDDDYRTIYHRSRTRYEDSDVWQAYRDKYLPHLATTHFDGQLEKMTMATFSAEITNLDQRMQADPELGEVWVAYQNDPAQACRYLVRRNYADDHVISRYFRHLALIDYLREQKGIFEREVLRVGEGSLQASEVAFIKPYSEERFRKAWDDIYHYMTEERSGLSDYQWCCLHHALSFEQRINNVSFRTFMHWLMDFSNIDTLISESNIKQCATNYFVATTTADWNLEQYRNHIISGKDKSRKGNKHFDKTRNRRIFNDMYDMAEELRKIIRKHA